MSALNNGTFIGRVGKDPETRHTQQGRPICSFSLAVKRPGKDAKGQEVTDWFQVSLWGKQAETATDLVRKGALLAVNGAVQIDEWTDRDGGKQKTVKISADGFQLLESKGSAEGSRQPTFDQVQERQRAPVQQSAHFNDDDIPPF